MKYTNTIKCDNHPRTNATKNVQLDWVVYDLDKYGSYKDINYSSGSDPMENHHLCASCFEKWEAGDLSL